MFFISYSQLVLQQLAMVVHILRWPFMPNSSLAIFMKTVNRTLFMYKATWLYGIVCFLYRTYLNRVCELLISLAWKCITEIKDERWRFLKLQIIYHQLLMRGFSQRGQIHPTILLKSTKSDLICIKVNDCMSKQECVVSLTDVFVLGWQSVCRHVNNAILVFDKLSIQWFLWNYEINLVFS